MRAIIFSCVKRSLKIDEIVKELEVIYDKEAPKRATVAKWVKRFRSGRINLNDDRRTGRPRDENTTSSVLKFFTDNPDASSREAADAVECSKMLVLTTLHKKLDFQYHSLE